MQVRQGQNQGHNSERAGVRFQMNTFLANPAACRNDFRSRLLQNFAKSHSAAMPSADHTHNTSMSAFLPALPLSVQFWWSSSEKRAQQSVGARLVPCSARLKCWRIGYHFFHHIPTSTPKYTVSTPNQRSGPWHVEKSGGRACHAALMLARHECDSLMPLCQLIVLQPFYQ